MKYYLSSYKFGDKTNTLKKLISKNNKLGHIHNACDFVGRNPEIANSIQQEEIDVLNTLGFDAKPLDLKDYFGKKEELKTKLDSLGALWVSGGNTFVLRQAMRLSGFDELFTNLIKRDDFLYGGYSAGICILSETLKSIDVVDDAKNFPYSQIKEGIYEGLGVFKYSFMPHYDSDHPESSLIDVEILRCIKNDWPYKTLKDGEVIIIE